MLWSSKSTFDGRGFEAVMFFHAPSWPQVALFDLQINFSSFGMQSSARTVALEKAACFVCHPSIRDGFEGENTAFEIEIFFFFSLSLRCVYGIFVFT